MIVDLKHLSKSERGLLLLQAGDRLEHVECPNIHPDRPSSQHFYEVHIKEDLLNTARRRRIERQKRKTQKDDLARRAKKEKAARRNKVHDPI